MFSNLLLEMRIREIKNKDIARAIGKSAKTVSSKLNGKTDFTLGELTNIKNQLFPDKSYQYLFFENQAGQEGERK